MLTIFNRKSIIYTEAFARRINVLTLYELDIYLTFDHRRNTWIRLNIKPILKSKCKLSKWKYFFSEVKNGSSHNGSCNTGKWCLAWDSKWACFQVVYIENILKHSPRYKRVSIPGFFFFLLQPEELLSHHVLKQPIVLQHVRW